MRARPAPLKPLLLTFSAAALLSGCASSRPATAAAPAPSPAPAAAPAQPGPQPEIGTFGFDVAGMDRATPPGQSFYRYSSGHWLDTTEIPADKASDSAFGRVNDRAQQDTRALLEAAAAANAPAGSDAQRAGDFYASYMDEAAIEALGSAPLKPELARIAAIKSRRELARALGETLRTDVDPLNWGDTTTDRLFGLWVAEDLGQPERYAAYLMQGGLGLPDRDYYLQEGPQFAEVRAQYQAYIASLLKLAGVDEAEARARAIYALEHKLARAHWSAVDSRDVDKAYNKVTRAELSRRAPGLDWDAYLKAAGLDAQAELVLWQPGAIAGIARLVGSEPLETWKAYLTFHAIDRAAPVLSKAFVDARFAFHGRTLGGAPQLRARWKRGVDATSGALGEIVGRLYVEKHFPPEAKAQMEQMVHNIRQAFAKRIDALAWMSPKTKAQAKAKLASMQVGIGYPDRWREDAGLQVVRGDAYGNAERASRFAFQRSLAKLGKPVDRTEWYMAPQVVNALNAPLQNSIVFPAAILRPPFFDPAADPAVNYGGIGAVIGHEIVHSFDDTGAKFDATGRLANWWTEEDARQFQAASQRLVAQYNSYRPLPDLAINGELTLGENIADIAGVAIAYDAYRESLGGQEAPVLEGFTGPQRFFLGFAQVWRAKTREPQLRQSLLTDGHAPAEYRAATVRNQDAWYEAFGAQPGQALYLAPAERVRIW